MKQRVFKAFLAFNGSINPKIEDCEISIISGGHINQSFDLRHQPSGCRFVIQELNPIFNLKAIEYNLQLFEKAQTQSDFLPPYWQKIHYLDTKKLNRKIHYDTTGNAWRVMRYLPGEIKIFQEFAEISLVKRQQIAWALGTTIALFSQILALVPVNKWQKPLPRFHDANYHWQYLQKILKKQESTLSLSQNQGQKVRLDEKFFQKHEKKITSLLKKIKKRKPLIACLNSLEQIATHGDLKINNAVFKLDQNQNFNCVTLIDLDTIQPGSILDDLGDALRSAGNPAGEEPSSLEEVSIDSQIIKAIITGFLQKTVDLKGSEKAAGLQPHTLKAGQQFLLVQCLRFLTDALVGNKYYRLKPGEANDLNLYRAEVQMKALVELEKQKIF